MVDSLPLIEADLYDRLTNVFGFSSFRHRQKEACMSVVGNRDVLLVMPTGAGKSLCYQLPTLATPDGRTLVISPLISLIEDQCAKLSGWGIGVGRIHSDLSRAECREACVRWKAGELKFLFLSPERLGMPGFLEFLENNKPTLIAVDEAHCISMWGHDFRSEYRNLSSRLTRLRPANIIALTATATPHVQNDIVTQLGLVTPEVFIDGFRRENLAIGYARINPEHRISALSAILKKSERLPCLVYVPTRKLADAVSAQLSKSYKVGAFHAGLTAEERTKSQGAFMRGELEVLIATNAFGMGIDKSNIRTEVHMSMCSSVESYYQEIGRAGRDGFRSVAIMMYAPVDKKILNFLLELNYPDVSVLRKVFSEVSNGVTARSDLQTRLDLSADLLSLAIDKLEAFGGVEFVNGFEIYASDPDWEIRYLAQRGHKEHLMSSALRLPSHGGCRMSRLVSYFEGHDGSDFKCGMCDVCDGGEIFGARYLESIFQDGKDGLEILKSLQPHQSKVKGQLYQEMLSKFGWTREKYEALLWDLEEEGLLFSITRSYERNGRLAQFQRLGLTEKARDLLEAFMPHFARRKTAIRSHRSESLQVLLNSVASRSGTTPLGEEI